MSLINKMLQDLDARGGTAAAQGSAADMRPVIPERRSRTVLALGAGAVLVALVAGGWMGWHYLRQASPMSPGPMPLGAGTPVVVAPVAPPPAIVVAPPSPVPAPGIVASPTSAPGIIAPAAPVSAAPVPAAAPSGMAAAAVPATIATASPATVPVLETSAEARKRRRAEATEAARQTAPRLKMAQAEFAEPAPSLREPAAPGREPAVPQPKAAARAVAVRANPNARAPGAESGERELTSQQRAENDYRRGLGALQEGRVAEAIATLEHAVYTDPRHDGARQTLVGLLIEGKRNDEAMRHLQLGLGLDPKQPAMAMILARLQIEKGGPAIDTLMRTLPYASGNAEYMGFLAGALQRAQRHREAVERYQAALQLASQNGVWWMGLGISLQAEKRNAEAQEAYNRAKSSGKLSPELQGFVDRKLQQLAR
ncbi:MAG: tetratricopeptide repeat protein [Pseudomonadota bacterium]